MPGFLADSDLTQALHDVLAKSPSVTLLPHWDSVVTAANQWAYNEIVTALTARGYSVGLIGQWDRGFDMQRNLGLWKCLIELASQQTGSIKKDAIDTFDQRDVLHGNPSKNIPPCGLTVGGVWQDPDTQVGQFVVGPMEVGDIPGDIFPGPWDRDPRKRF